MQSSEKFLSNHYLISPISSLHHVNHALRIYGLTFILLCIPFIHNKKLKIIITVINLILIYNKSLLHYFQDFRYICITLFFYYLIYIKNIKYNYINFKINFINSLPNYLIRITYIVILYFIILRILVLTTPSEYIFIYLFDIITKFICFDFIFILITSLSYQLLDRLLYNLEILQLFIIINKHYWINQSFNINKKLFINLTHKYIHNLLQDAEKISYILYSRKIKIFSFYLYK